VSAPRTATSAVAAVAAGAISVSDIAAGCLETVRELDPSIGAFRVIDAAAVRRAAKVLDGETGGRLRGMVVGVKDVIDTADLPTAYGSPLFTGHQPAADADVVAKLRRAGALVLGKTESTEFAMFQPTRTRNPADLGRTPGGSSSGSAAAVAAGMVHLALGTQTAGSVVRPAAYCGVYGFKPTRGWTSTRGIWLLSGELDTVGLFARCVADLVLAHRALRGGPPGQAPPAAHLGPGGAHRARAAPAVTVLTATEWAACDDDVYDALRFVADRLSDQGWRVTETSMPDAWRELPGQQATVMAAEVARNMRARLGERLGQISASARAIVELGDRCTEAEYLAALEARDEARRALRPLSAATDLLLAPSALGVAPEGLAVTGDPVMCRPWTLLGLPAANVPAYRRRDGLPVGVQLVGLADDDLSYLTDLALAERAIQAGEPAAAGESAGATETTASGGPAGSAVTR
jgi:Asp-tRNA(Asn)/Glu-tRNA(Gln) amidotransferase A subunit family amidase